MEDRAQGAARQSPGEEGEAGGEGQPLGARKREPEPANTHVCAQPPRAGAQPLSPSKLNIKTPITPR